MNPESSEPDPLGNSPAKPRHNDPLQRDLMALAAPLRDAGERTEKLRPIVERLLGRPHEECYDRLIDARVDPPQASRLASLASCREAGEKFLKGLSWEKAVLQAQAQRRRKRMVSEKEMSRLTPKKKAAYRLAAMMLGMGLAELRQPEGLLRLVQVAAPLSPSRKKYEQERTAQI